MSLWLSLPHCAVCWGCNSYRFVVFRIWRWPELYIQWWQCWKTGSAYPHYEFRWKQIPRGKMPSISL